jgi:TIR domain
LSAVSFGRFGVSRIFLSHSSINNAEAVALRDWFSDSGWKDEIFLDLDPQRGIAAGERWERKLHEAANRCEAVLFLVSKAWLASVWCRKELNLAHSLNKRLFGVLIEELPVGAQGASASASAARP